MFFYVHRAENETQQASTSKCTTHRQLRCAKSFLKAGLKRDVRVRIQNKSGNGRSSDETRHREESHGPEVMAAKHIHPPCDDQVPAVCRTCPHSDTPYRVWKRADGGIIIGWWAAGAARGLMEHLRRDNQPP